MTFDLRDPLNAHIASAYNTHKPEVVSVLVIGPVIWTDALRVAPYVASLIWPERKFGAALHAEPATDPVHPSGSWYVDVEVL